MAVNDPSDLIPQTVNLAARARKTTLEHSVLGCPRCGEDHAEMTFTQFVNADGSPGWSHWAMCPVTNEPICVRYGGGDYLPGVAEMASAHAEWAAEIRAIVHGQGPLMERMRKIDEVLDKVGVAEWPEVRNEIAQKM